VVEHSKDSTKINFIFVPWAVIKCTDLPFSGKNR
jgi:hypothetical protein